ncbi:MAG: DUF3515 domain-containing protein [Actinophytocola sp.]|uniref:DUF3515 domain-containing protein n=1 Tax=Actinophytocola sp. TaxID=1872138 RepID=UPI003D6B6E46
MSDDPLTPTTLRLAVGIVALLAVGIVVASLVLSSGSDQPTEQADHTTAPRTGPLAVVGVDAPEARSAPCAALIEALPATLPDNGKTLRTLPIAKPRPPATTAWGGERGEPLVLRCGLAPPAELTPTAALREISGVRWLPVTGAGATTWYVVDRAVYVALTVPDGTGTGPLQDVSAAVGTLPAQPVRARG